MSATQSKTAHITQPMTLKGTSYVSCSCGWTRQETGLGTGGAVFMAEQHERAMADEAWRQAEAVASEARSAHAQRAAATRKANAAAKREAPEAVAAPEAPVAPSKPAQPCQWVACQAPATTTRLIGSTSWHVCSTHRVGFSK